MTFIHNILIAALLVPVAPIFLFAKPVVFQAGCEDGGVVKILSAEFIEPDKITVRLDLCTPIDPRSAADRKARFRVHFDHTPPFFMDSDRNDDSRRDTQDFCFETSDTVLMRRPAKRDRGPGRIMPDVDASTSSLTYETTLRELGVPPETKQLYIWADVIRNRGEGGLIDRWPRPSGTSVCAETGWKVVIGLTIPR